MRNNTEHAYAGGGLASAAQEGRHKNCQQRVEEHRTDRAFQAPLFQPLHCQHFLGYRCLLLLPKKAIGGHRFC